MRCVQPIGETGKNGHSLIQHIISSLFDLLLLKNTLKKICFSFRLGFLRLIVSFRVSVGKETSSQSFDLYFINNVYLLIKVITGV